MAKASVFTIGKVTGVHGLKGFVKVASFAESVSTFSPGTKLLARDQEDNDTCYTVQKASSHKKGLIVLFKGMDRDAAERLVGYQLCIRRDDLPELAEDTYYWEDLIGLKVTDVTAGYLGEINSVIATGSNDVFVVKEGGRETMIPALSGVVRKVDVESNTMVVDLPEDLR